MDLFTIGRTKLTKVDYANLHSNLPADYAAIYTDKHGRNETTIHNYGTLLRMVVRGVEFIGSSFYDFSPVAGTSESDLIAFCLNKYPEGAVELCDCKIECAIPVPLESADGRQEGVLNVTIVLGRPTDRGWLTEDHVRLELDFRGKQYASRGTSGWFEDELLDIQRALPSDALMLACVSCQFSDYSVYGHGTFGDLLCFRGSKQEYLAVTNKTEYLNLRPTAHVQETYLCPEFHIRKAGTGYRG